MQACSEDDTPRHPATEVAKGFFWQTPGAMLPYAVGLLVLGLSTGTDATGGATGGATLGLAAQDAATGGATLGPAARDAAAVSLQFRLVLGLGAVPALLTMALCYFQADSASYVAARSGELESSGSPSSGSSNPVAVALRHPEHWRRLVGTGLSWLLYDYVYYGTAFNQPRIIEQVFCTQPSVPRVPSGGEDGGCFATDRLA